MSMAATRASAVRLPDRISQFLNIPPINPSKQQCLLSEAFGGPKPCLVTWTELSGLPLVTQVDTNSVHRWLRRWIQNQSGYRILIDHAFRILDQQVFALNKSCP